MIQAGCRSPELVAFFFPLAWQVHAPALSHEGVVKQPSSTVDAGGDTPGLGHCVLTAEGPDWWWFDIVVGSVVSVPKVSFSD